MMFIYPLIDFNVYKICNDGGWSIHMFWRLFVSPFGCTVSLSVMVNVLFSPLPK